jgi:uncharacterized protein YqeY
MSLLKLRIQEDMKTAMRGQDKSRLMVIRLILAALKQKEVDERVTLSDADIIAILDKMLKQRRESIVQYEKGNRADLAAQEKFEIDLIQTYMPAALSEAEATALVLKAIAETSAKSIQDMGKVMAVLKPQLLGRADMAWISQQIKQHLS